MKMDIGYILLLNEATYFLVISFCTNDDAAGY